MIAIPIATAFRARIMVRLDPAVNDPQGNTVRDGLIALDHADVRDVRIGRVIELTLDAPDATDARARAAQMCDDLLVNPVIETVEIEVAELT